MRNIMRWLQNRFGQQKKLVRYTCWEGDFWHRWPYHLTAPLESDFRKVPGHPDKIGKAYQFFGLGKDTPYIVCHPTFTLYVDGIHQLKFHSMLFPSGAVWDTTLWISKARYPWRSTDYHATTRDPSTV